jgi:hypothetical protein
MAEMDNYATYVEGYVGGTSFAGGSPDPIARIASPAQLTSLLANWTLGWLG